MIRSLPDHLVSLSPSQWALWRRVALRGAGFPFQEALKLSTPDCGHAADLLIEAEDHAERLWQIALDALRQEIESCRPELRPQVLKAFRLLGRGKTPGLASLSAAASRAVSDFAQACQIANSNWASFHQVFNQATARVSLAVDQIFRDERFRQAIIWQNRRAFHRTNAILLKSPAAESRSRNRDRKRAEELIAQYWQRYCAKNDMIGFFGPVGWGEISPQVETIAVRPGPDLIRSRGTYFEVWCIDALAQSLAEQDLIRPYIAPRRLPYSDLQNSTLFLPPHRTIELSPQQSALLRACDGRKTARQIAHELIDNPKVDLSNETEAYRLLKDLLAEGIILWAPAIPPGARPEQALWQTLETIDDDQVRSFACGALSEFQEAYRQVDVAASADNTETLDQALSDLESAFTRLTKIESTRAEGKMYAGRTLVYQDCGRDIEVEIGQQILQTLAPPLSLLLASARWLTFKVAVRYRQIFAEVYAELAHQTGNASVNAFSFWSRIQSRFFAGAGGPGAEFQSLLQERWMEILAVPSGQRSVTYRSEQLLPDVQTTFQAPGPGWQYARYHSPDVMIAANSVEAIRNGDYQLVLGEIHIATNTLNSVVYVEQHPSRSDFYLAIDADLRESRVIPIPPKSWLGRTGRNHNILISPKDVCIELAAHSPGFLNARAMPISSFVITREGQDLILRTRDAGIQVNLIDAFADLLMDQIVNSFKVINPDRHTPRIAIDRLIISRESWLFPPSEIKFAFEKDSDQRYLAARRWARLHQLPRFVFYKSPIEVKPCFLDFDSPIYVDIFAKAVRLASESSDQELLLSEMLPSPDQIWLPDSQGNHYTCEIRLVAVDLSTSSLP